VDRSGTLDFNELRTMLNDIDKKMTSLPAHKSLTSRASILVAN